MVDTTVINTSEPTVNKLPDALDALTHTALARVTRGLSPTAGLMAWHDWAVHLAISPGKQRSLLNKALEKQQRFTRYALHATATPHCANCIEPLE